MSQLDFEMLGKCVDLYKGYTRFATRSFKEKLLISNFNIQLQFALFHGNIS